jgi:hypothetical protein
LEQIPPRLVEGGRHWQKSVSGTSEKGQQSVRYLPGSEQRTLMTPRKGPEQSPPQSNYI